MNIRNRIARLEDRIGRGDEPCPDHRTTRIMGDADAEPVESEIQPCPNCGRPGRILRIVEVIVDGDVDGELVGDRGTA